MGGRSGTVGRKPRRRQQPPVSVVYIKPEEDSDVSAYFKKVEKQKKELDAQPEADRDDMDLWLLQNTKRQQIEGKGGAVDYMTKDQDKIGRGTKSTGRIEADQRWINPQVEDYMTTTTQNEKRETAALLHHRSGEALGGVLVGSSDSVSFDEVPGKRDKILTHTHPSSSSFSPEDTTMLLVSPGLNAIRAVGAYQDKKGNTENYVYTMQKVAGAEYAAEKPNSWDAEVKNVRAHWHHERMKLQPEYEEKVYKKHVSPHDAWLEHSHRINIEVARQRNLIYTRITPTGTVEKHYPNGNVEVIERGQFTNDAEDNIDALAR